MISHHFCCCFASAFRSIYFSFLFFLHSVLSHNSNFVSYNESNAFCSKHQTIHLIKRLCNLNWLFVWIFSNFCFFKMSFLEFWYVSSLSSWNYFTLRVLMLINVVCVCVCVWFSLIPNQFLLWEIRKRNWTQWTLNFAHKIIIIVVFFSFISFIFCWFFCSFILATF